MSAPVITVSEMRAWESATWAAGVTESAVIARVGELVARRARQLTRPDDAILILAGKGHNGDDARLAQPHLTDRRVTVLEVLNPATALKDFDRAVATSPPALILDGLFGLGLNRSLSSEWRRFLRRVNESNAEILALDVPSGLNADTGEPAGEAIRATLTLTLGAPKAGLLRASAWPFVGRLEVAAEIGLVPCPHRSESQWTLPGDFFGYPPRRPVTGHKGTFGHLVILAGSVGYHGAAVLATRAALRARPGLVTLSTTEATYAAVAAQTQAAMVHPWRPGGRLPDSASAFLVGPGLAAPGLSPDHRAEVRFLWENSPLPVIADASALDWLPPGNVRAGALRFLTPHPGEAARRLGTTAAAVQADRPAAVRELSRRFGDAWVVLKGHQTIIGRTGPEIFYNGSGNPGLAQGGSGDVLAGYLGGLLAQPVLQADPLTALRCGVWQHGATADWLAESQPANWTIAELVEQIGRVVPE